MNRSPASYWRSLASIPTSCCNSRDGRLARRRRSRRTRANISASGTASWPARSMVMSPCPSSRLIMAWMRLITSSCSGGATSPSIPASSRGFFPARTAAAARRSASAKRRGSGATADMAWSTSERKWGRNHGTPVNWHRWVTSCSAIHNRNCLAGKLWRFSRATMFGPTYDTTPPVSSPSASRRSYCPSTRVSPSTRARGPSGHRWPGGWLRPAGPAGRRCRASRGPARAVAGTTTRWPGPNRPGRARGRRRCRWRGAGRWPR